MRDNALLTTRSPVLPSGSYHFSRSWLFEAVPARILFNLTAVNGVSAEFNNDADDAFISEEDSCDRDYVPENDSLSNEWLQDAIEDIINEDEVCDTSNKFLMFYSYTLFCYGLEVWY